MRFEICKSHWGYQDKVDKLLKTVFTGLPTMVVLDPTSSASASPAHDPANAQAVVSARARIQLLLNTGLSVFVGMMSSDRIRLYLVASGILSKSTARIDSNTMLRSEEIRNILDGVAPSDCVDVCCRACARLRHTCLAEPLRSTNKFGTATVFMIKRPFDERNPTFLARVDFLTPFGIQLVHYKAFSAEDLNQCKPKTAPLPAFSANLNPDNINSIRELILRMKQSQHAAAAAAADD